MHPSDDLELESNQVPKPAIIGSSVAEDQEWVSGMRLATIMAAVTLVCFLMLLDISIIVTVHIKTPYSSCLSLRCYHRPFPGSRANSTLFLM